MSQTSKSLPAIRPNPDVLFRRLDCEVILFHLGSDRFYELNGTAARFWELLSAGDDAAAIKEKMLEEFAVDPEQLAGEATTLIASLRREDLITLDE
jgi:hypothetical protein